jgi:hypothetical protein
MARVAALFGTIGLVPAIALAQAPVPSATGATGGTSSAMSPTAEAPSSSTSPAQPVVPATGYGWTTPKRKTDHRPARVAHRGEGPDALMPGFETLADGSTRLFVELSKPVAYETRAGRGTITYVLKDAHVGLRNNYNPLVTVHFNTPVTSARLVPHGRDLLFVIDLRANVQPTVALDAGKDGGSMMRIEFPKGDYLPASAGPGPAAQPAAATPSSSSAAAATPPSTPSHP